MAKLNKAQIIQLRNFLSQNFQKNEVDQILVRNNHHKLWNAYQKRTVVTVTIDSRQVRIDFSSIPPAQPQKQRNLSENVTESKPVLAVRGKGKKPVKKITSVALDPDMFEQLKRMADKRGTSTGYLIRLSLKKFLEMENL